MYEPEVLDILTRTNFDVASDKFPGLGGAHILVCVVAGLHKRSVRVRELRGCSIAAVGQGSLEISAIILVLARLSNGDVIDREFTLTEQRVEEIISYGRVGFRVHILPRPQINFLRT